MLQKNINYYAKALITRQYEKQHTKGEVLLHCYFSFYRKATGLPKNYVL